VLNADGNLRDHLSPKELLQTFSWIPQLNVISNSCGLASWLQTLPMTRNFPVLTLPVGVDMQRFFPMYRYWSEERTPRVIIMIKRQQVEPLIGFSQEFIAVTFLRFDYGMYSGGIH
jgi:hypothetical protein